MQFHSPSFFGHRILPFTRPRHRCRPPAMPMRLRVGAAARLRCNGAVGSPVSSHFCLNKRLRESKRSRPPPQDGHIIHCIAVSATLTAMVTRSFTLAKVWCFANGRWRLTHFDGNICVSARGMLEMTNGVHLRRRHCLFPHQPASLLVTFLPLRYLYIRHERRWSFIISIFRCRRKRPVVTRIDIEQAAAR